MFMFYVLVNSDLSIVEQILCQKGFRRFSGDRRDKMAVKKNTAPMPLNKHRCGDID